MHLKKLQSHSFKRRWGVVSDTVDNNKRIKVGLAAVRQILGRKYALNDFKARYF
jgi:hypothetical protein